jgi:hypothetical protein
LVNSDCHGTELIGIADAENIACGAGLNPEDVRRVTRRNATLLLNEIL